MVKKKIKKNSVKAAKIPLNNTKSITISKIFTIPNCLTFLRIVLAPFFMLTLLDNQYLLALVIIVVASITDFFDGWIARKFDMESDIGRILDPIADKVLIFLSVVALLIKFDFPLWIGLIIIGRDALILSGGLLLIHRKITDSFKPNIIGKISTFFQMVTITVFVLAHIFYYYSLWIDILLYLTVMLTLLSGLSYLIKGYKILSVKQL